MGLRFVAGNLVGENADAVVNTVNCVGVMGKGIALQFKNAFPQNFEAYAAACKNGEVRPGRMFIYKTDGLTNPKYIINFPTKQHWKGKSRLADIDSGLQALVEDVKRLEIGSIGIPALGCGNGGLQWDVVRPLIERAFKLVPAVDARVYAPAGAPAPATQPVRTKRPRLTRVRAALVTLLSHYQSEGYKKSLLEIQKLAYLLQVSGQSLGLRFEKEKYGPYAESLNFVLQEMEGHYVRGYGDRSQAAEIELVEGAVEEARAILMDDRMTEHVSRVLELIEGYETPHGMELLATVHWVLSESRLAEVDEDVAVRATQAWNARKMRIFTPSHIRRARWRLIEQGWLSIGEPRELPNM